MKLIFLFSVFFLFFCLPCSGSETLSDKEIQKKVNELYGRILEADQQQDQEKLLEYLKRLLHYEKLLSDDSPYKSLAFFYANQRIGALKYEMRQYAEAIPFSEKALNSDMDKKHPQAREWLQEHKLDIYIALMKSYHKTGNPEERDRKWSRAKKLIENQIMSSGEKQYSRRTVDSCYFFYVVESEIYVDQGKNAKALESLLKMEQLYSTQAEYNIAARKDILFRIAWLYFLRQDWDKSIEYSKRAIQIYARMDRFPDYVYVLLIRAYLQKREYDTALQVSAQYLQWCNLHSSKGNTLCKADIYYCMGKLYLLSGESEKSEFFLKSASEIVPMQSLEKTLGAYFRINLSQSK